SKKEKEREKKEKEKLRKKQQMERKKAAATTGEATPDELKSAAKEATTETAPVTAPAPTPAAGKKGGKADPKGKTKNKMLAALERQVELQRQAEEKRRQEEEEERRRIEEEERRAAEEIRLKEEAKARKKEKEKAKRDELKREGKLLTKKQKDAIQLQQKRAQQLREAGVYIAGFDEKAQDDNKKKRPVYGKKKSKPDDKSSTKEGSVSLENSVDNLAEVVEAKAEGETQAAEEIDEIPAEKEVDAPHSWEDALKSDNDEEAGDSWENLLASGEESNGSSSDSNGSTQKTEISISSEDKKTLSTKEQEEADADELARKEEELRQAERKVQIERLKAEAEQRKAEASQRRDKRHRAALDARSQDNLRSPICCILGHVDTGKTKLLDKVRQTNVQEGEAGGITQQIGATYFPIEAIKQKTAVVNKDQTMEYKVPGLLIIDTPGHESFTNLRSRGSSLCNIAILVIDIMHGLEQQTLESIRLLRSRKTPFIVALNKIDRLYGWEAIPDNGVQDSLAKQSNTVQREFEDRVQKTKLALAEQGLNSELYYKNRNMARNVSLVPTSAVTGEGVPDMLKLLIDLTQNRMSDKLMYLSELECTVLEVKVIEGLGTTIDVVLSNGILREGDRIVLCGMNGPIATNVRALLTPQPLRELRVKSAYVHHKEVKAALGVKIAANDLDKAIAGSRLLLVGPDDDEEELMDEVMSDLASLESALDKSGRGVCVQASTLGSLEALLDFLKQMKIPVMSISIGPVFKRDVMKATTMLEKAREFAVMLCFDVKIDKEAEEYAEQQGIRIFSADIIYHLFDAFTNYQKELLEVKRKETAAQAVFPCVLHTVKIINKRNPMIIGVDVSEGSLRIGTPIATVRIDPATQMRQMMQLGRVISLEVNHKSVDIVKKGQAQGGVAMRLDTPANQPTWGRHVDETDTLYSEISRESIDTLKDPAYRDDVTRDEWLLLRQLKAVFSIA
ncbi:P-loop containing nucleoside triphosphate hydrolase protein, partial [Lipomyces doorenjongii]|uniref:P-loop containing nucleoside triphosphate hydrolase protein n=1 Tax=Lipomyces doorenjongii TaxID=383834 RepID=UPI0034CD3F57